MKLQLECWWMSAGSKIEFLGSNSWLALDESCCQSSLMEMAPRALITGGQGDLALTIGDELRGVGFEVLSPGRDQLDVASEDSVIQFASGLESVDFLIVNAGASDDRLLMKMPESSWDRILEVNLHGAARTARLLGKKLRKGGSLTFIGSFSAQHPPVGQVAYAAAKAGLEGLTKSLAIEWGRRGTRVNLVLPGFIETKFSSGVSAKRKSEVLERHVLGHLNTPQELARFLRFLHQDLVSTSGQVFNLDSRIY